jgi:transposase InsO family protein
MEDGRGGGLRSSGQKLSESEKDAIVEAFHQPEFIDLPVRSAWVKMLDQGQCLCSPATVFRVLDERKAKGRLTTRRASPQRRPPVLEATAVDQVWTWDITYLPTGIRGAYFYLYSVQDLFSRKIVGWAIEASEEGVLARDLFGRILSERVSRPQDLQVHADNGSPMRAKALKSLFDQLEVRYTHGRPHVSDDNAFIESWFSVLKSRASFPEYFRDIEQAREYVGAMVEWYNGQHMHSRLDYLTPEQMDQGVGEPIQAHRNEVIERARALRPQRYGSKKLQLRVPTKVRLTFHETVSYN